MRLKYPDQEYSANNPYVFATWDEFAEINSIPKDSRGYVYFEGDTTGIYEDETKRVIDLNDSHPEGFENSITFDGTSRSYKLLHLDGKGWTIRNFVSFARNAFEFRNLSYDTYMKNLNFLNCYHNTTVNQYTDGMFIYQHWKNSSVGHGLQLINCKFSLLINAYNGSYWAVFGGKQNATLKTNLCSFNIKFFNRMTDGTKIFSDYMTNCNIKIKCFKNTDVINTNLEPNCTFINCKFYLDFKSTSSNSNYTWVFSNDSVNKATFNNCYIDGKYENINEKLMIYAGTINNVSIINSTHLNIPDKTTSNFTKLTNDQCISEEYLDSIGFPVIIEGD